MEKKINKGNDKHEDADSLLHKKSYPMFIRNFKILGAVVPEKSLTKILLEKKKNGQIKGMIGMRMLILSYTIQQVIPNVYTKFQNPRCSSS